MSEEIYINTGTSFQQQYTARQPAIGTAPTIANYVAQGLVNAQTPSIAQARQPSIAQYNTNTQTPYPANAQQPYPYIAQAVSQTPYIGNAQTPYPYIANTPTTYQAQGNTQVTYQYQASEQTPSIGQARQPYTYQSQGQTPTSYQNRQPSTFQAQGNQPTTYDATGQNPFTYARQARQPATYNHRQPSITTYATQGQTPFTYQAQSPSSYATQGQNPFTYNRTGRTPFTYQARTPINGSYTTQGRTPVITNQQTTINAQGSTSGQTTGDDRQGNMGGQNSEASMIGQNVIYGFAGQRYARFDFRMMHWRHTNGYQYCYWYIRGGNPGETPVTGIPMGIQSPASQVYLYQGTTQYWSSGSVSGSNAWHLVEQWTFASGFQPDSINMNNNTTSYPTGGGNGTTTTAQMTCPTTGSDLQTSYEGFRTATWWCEEGFIPNGGTSVGTETITPTMVKSGFANLIGSSHTLDWEGYASCSYNCFTAGSKVLLEDGTDKNIEDIVVNDKCYGQDGTINNVKELRIDTDVKATIYTLNGGIEITGGHPVLTTTGWKSCNQVTGENLHPELNITELVVGDTLVKYLDHEGNQSEEELTSLTVEVHESMTLYNLDVEDAPSGNDTYVVDNYVVHNK